MINKTNEDSDINITKEDQDKINQFAVTHAKESDLNLEQKVIQKDLELLKDASDEVMIADEDKIPYMIGENFIMCDKDNLEKRYNFNQNYMEKKKEIADQIEELTKIKDNLKAELTAKLGTSINLTAE